MLLLGKEKDIFSHLRKNLLFYKATYITVLFGTVFFIFRYFTSFNGKRQVIFKSFTLGKKLNFIIL